MANVKVSVRPSASVTSKAACHSPAMVKSTSAEYDPGCVSPGLRPVERHLHLGHGHVAEDRGPLSAIPSASVRVRLNSAFRMGSGG